MDPSIEIILKGEDNGDLVNVPITANLIIGDEETEDSTIAKSHTHLADNFRIVNTLCEFEELLRAHEVQTCSKYTIYKTSGLFKGYGRDLAYTPKVHWGALGMASASLALTPYLIVGSRYYFCHLGKCYYTSRLQKNRKDSNGSRKRYNKLTESKKIGCPASFRVQRLVVFPDNQVNSDSPSEKANMGHYIKQNISSLRVEHVYLFKFPDISEHEKHGEGNASYPEPIDKQIVGKIQECVADGVTSRSHIEYLLKQFVKNEMEIDKPMGRRFCPTRRDVKRIVQLTQKKIRSQKIDLNEFNESFIRQLGDSNEVYSSTIDHCHARNTPNDVSNIEHSSFIFVFQNAKMRRLFNLYGSSCFLLDPTFRFCKYSIPFYSVVVQTNTSFQTVAILIIEVENKRCLTEALKILSNWNSDISPKYILVDNNNDEINAIENVFPKAATFIPSFYVINAWRIHFSFGYSDSEQSEVLGKVKAVIEATSENALDAAVSNVKKLCCRNKRAFFESKWLRKVKKWASFYKPPDLLFESNVAVDCLGDELRYLSLVSVNNLSLTNFIKFICQEFIPETLCCYSRFNQNICPKSSFGSYIPAFILGRPQWVITNVLDKMKVADQLLSYSFVEALEETQFSVHVKNENNEKFEVNFDIDRKIVRCNCLFYTKRKFVCEHAVIVGRYFPAWSIDKISSWLLNDPIFNKDTSCIESTQWEHIVEKKEEFSDSTEKCNTIQCFVEESSDATEDPSLVDECMQYLVTFERIAESISSQQLSTFRDDLRDLHQRWTKSLREDEISETEELPIPYLKKVKRLFSDKIPNSSSNTSKRFSSGRSVRRRKERKLNNSET